MDKWKNPNEGEGDKEYIKRLDSHKSKFSHIEQFENFAMFTPRWSLMRFIVKYELLKKVLDVPGIIIEAGVYHGGGLMSWAQLSSILEPYNHQRKVVGFDTFGGFPELNEEDGTVTNNKYKGAWGSDSFREIMELSYIHDMTRCVGHIPKVELVKGDVINTAEQYLVDNPHTIVSLLYLDVDLYEPTQKIINVFLKRMPKGGIIAFDQLNTKEFPGETLAIEKMLPNLELKRFQFTSLTYAVL